MKLHQDIKLSYNDVFLVPKRSVLQTRLEANLSWAIGPFQFRSPVIPANMDTIAGLKMMVESVRQGALAIHHRYASLEDYINARNTWGNLFDEQVYNYPFAVSVGSIYTPGEADRIDWVTKSKNAQIICLDIAHAHSGHGMDTIKYIKDKNPNIVLIAGNVCTPAGTRALKEWGADVVKVGIAAGGVCTTAIKTGCYYPQFSAVMECAETGVPIIADGGITSAGCAAKALGAGAIAVMAGSLFAGTDCVPGWDEAQEKVKQIFEKYPTGADRHYHLGQDQVIPKATIAYRGMASKEARKANNHEGTNAEGVSRQIICKPEGSTAEVFSYIHEGIRSAMSYTGAFTLTEFFKEAEFIQITKAGLDQAHPHFKDH